ncbi:hypothetical protein BHE74_00058479 [Ensete ventricosum]|nr:hypothetical protein BHE74_00058479 [Ensete ventricosum]
MQGGRPLGAAACGQPCLQQGDSARRRGGRPLAGRLPAGKGSDGGAEGERGVRASFREKDDAAPINSRNSEDCPRVHNSHNTLNNPKNSEDDPLI